MSARSPRPTELSKSAQGGKRLCMFFMEDWEFFMSGRGSENMGQRVGTSQAEGLATSGWWQRKGEPEQNPVDSRIAAKI